MHEGMIRIRKRLTYANVIATICLLAVAGPSLSWASARLGGADIRDGSLTGKDIRNGSLKAADLSAATRSALTDTSPWETIPSGRLVTGAFDSVYTVREGNDLHVETLQLPARPPQAFGLNDVAFAPDSSNATGNEDPACTGTFELPTAPAGKICLYLGSELGVANAIGTGAQSATVRALGVFQVMWNDDVTKLGGETNGLYGTWAYRAP